LDFSWLAVFGCTLLACLGRLIGVEVSVDLEMGCQRRGFAVLHCDAQERIG
jgi:hypothetical protein